MALSKHNSAKFLAIRSFFHEIENKIGLDSPRSQPVFAFHPPGWRRHH
jgi:hypothetical protein